MNILVFDYALFKFLFFLKKIYKRKSLDLNSVIVYSDESMTTDVRIVLGFLHKERF